MELLKQLELVDVTFEDQKATLVFLDEDRGEIREVNWNRKSYDNGKWIDDPEKAEKVDKWAEEFFGLSFDRLAEAIGERRDIYAYDGFNSLYEVQMVSKFDESFVGQLLDVEVNEVTDDGRAIRIFFEYEGDRYESKMTYSTYMEAKKEWFVNPQKRTKQYEKFEEKFGFPVADKEQLVGRNVMVEVKKALGKYVYCEIKPFPKKKK